MVLDVRVCPFWLMVQGLRLLGLGFWRLVPFWVEGCVGLLKRLFSFQSLSQKPEVSGLRCLPLTAML